MLFCNFWTLFVVCIFFMSVTAEGWILLIIVLMKWMDLVVMTPSDSNLISSHCMFSVLSRKFRKSLQGHTLLYNKSNCSNETEELWYNNSCQKVKKSCRVFMHCSIITSAFFLLRKHDMIGFFYIPTYNKSNKPRKQTLPTLYRFTWKVLHVFLYATYNDICRSCILQSIK